MDLYNSNELIKNIIQNNEKYIICRPGWGGDGIVPAMIKKNIKIPQLYIYQLWNNAGIYFRDNNLQLAQDKNDLLYYTDVVMECYKNSKAFGFMKGAKDFLNILYTMLLKEYQLKMFKRDVFDIWRFQENECWIHLLKNKKILIISPFSKLMKKQYDNYGNKLFNNKNILPKFNFIAYNSYLTAGGNKLHTTWKETYIKMCNDIKKINFDIALLGCGGYGHPLCNFIYTELNKPSIYIGGTLQTMFGVKGKRWIKESLLNKYVNDLWCFPDNNTKIKSIENGCYWS